MTDISTTRLLELIAVAEKATPIWEWGVDRDHGEIHSWPGRFKVETTVLEFGWDGEEGIYADNSSDIGHIAACDPQTIIAIARELIERRGSE